MKCRRKSGRRDFTAGRFFLHQARAAFFPSAVDERNRVCLRFLPNLRHTVSRLIDCELKHGESQNRRNWRLKSSDIL